MASNSTLTTDCFRTDNLTATKNVLDTAGSDACAKVQDQLMKAWNVIEPNAEACGSALFR